MARRIVSVLVLALVVAGGAFAQVVVGAGININGKEFEGKSGSNTSTNSDSSINIPLSAGYRIGPMGFGLAATIEWSEYKDDTGTYMNELVYTNLEIGGYFEYALLSLEKFALYGNAELRYKGASGFTRDWSGSGGPFYKGDYNGFYAKVKPVFEYSIIPHVTLFASFDLISFSIGADEYKQQWNSGTEEWDDLSGVSLKDTWTSFSLPLTRGINDISLGVKFVF